MSRVLRILSFCLLSSYGLSIYVPQLQHRSYSPPLWLFNGYRSSTNHNLLNALSHIKSNARFIETYLRLKEGLLASNQVLSRFEAVRIKFQ